MTNLVAITVKASDATPWAAIKAEAAKMGAEAADAFNRAFKLRADASGGGGKSGLPGSSEGLLGESSQGKSLISRLYQNANQPGGIGILGAGPQGQALLSQLKAQMSKPGGIGLFSGTSGGGAGGGEPGLPSAAGASSGNSAASELAKAVAANTEAVDNNTGASDNNSRFMSRLASRLGGGGGGDAGTKSFLGGLLGRLGGKGAGGAGAGNLLAGGGGANPLNAGGVAGGALPGIMGLSGMQATIIGLVGALAALLPAIVTVGAGLGVIAGGFVLAMATSKQFAGEVKKDLAGLEKIGGEVVKPLIGPLEAGLASLMGYFKQIAPDLKLLFGAAGPLIAPLVKGFEELMSGAGPGFFAMIKAAGPVFQSMSGAFANLGRSLGTMFSDFASDGKGSASMLSGLLGIINSLLPFIGALGKIMVSALAPAFQAFSGALGEVLPALDPLLKILGGLAGAVLSDLGSVLGAVGALLKGLAPSFTLLAKAASSVFSTLENTGIFAILGDALENLAKPLANLINALVQGFAPALPQIVTLVAQLSGAFVTLVSDGLGVALNALTELVKIFRPILPLLLEGLVAWKALTIAVAAFNLVMDMNPFVAIGAALVILIGLIVKYHTQILAFIERIWNDVYSFLKSLWGSILSFAQQWWPLLLGPAGLIVKYHEQIWQFIQRIWNDISNFIASAWDTIWNDTRSAVSNGVSDVIGFFENLPGRVLRALLGLGTDLWNLANTWLTDLLHGAESVWNDVLHFFEGIPGDILHALGIHSPPDWAIQAGEHIMNGIGIGMSNAKGVVESAMKSVASRYSGPIPGAGGAGGSVAALMQRMAAQRGWTGNQWNALYDVEMAEAGFNLNATNPSSGAYGLAQFINGPSEYYQYGGNPNTAAGQITGFLNYVAQRYGTPEAAWGHEEAYHWYGTGLQGGIFRRPTLIGVGERGPESVNVTPVGAGHGGVVLEVISGGGSEFEQFMAQFLKKYVRIHGGGDVQRALGRP